MVSLSRIGLISKSANNEYEIGALALDLAFKALNQLDPVDEACKIAKELNRKFIGIEKEVKYYELAVARVFG